MKDSQDWVDRLKMDDWSAEQMARFLVYLPFERRTWELAAARETRYQRGTGANAEPRLLTQGKHADQVRYEVRHTVEMFLKHREIQRTAVFALLMALPQMAALEPGLLMDVLETGLKAPGQMQNIVYGIPLLFQELERRREQNDPRVDLQRLAQLEWGYLDLLDGHSASPAALHKLLRDEPESFVETLGAGLSAQERTCGGCEGILGGGEEAGRECLPVADVVARCPGQPGRPNS